MNDYLAVSIFTINFVRNFPLRQHTVQPNSHKQQDWEAKAKVAFQTCSSKPYGKLPPLHLLVSEQFSPIPVTSLCETLLVIAVFMVLVPHFANSVSAVS